MQRPVVVLSQVGCRGREGELDAFFLKFSRNFQIHPLTELHVGPVIRRVIPVKYHDIQRGDEVRLLTYQNDDESRYREIEERTCQSGKWVVSTRSDQENRYIKRRRQRKKRTVDTYSRSTEKEERRSRDAKRERRRKRNDCNLASAGKQRQQIQIQKEKKERSKK